MICQLYLLNKRDKRKLMPLNPVGIETLEADYIYHKDQTWCLEGGPKISHTHAFQKLMTSLK